MGRRSWWLAVVAIALTSCMTTQDAVPEDGLQGGAPIVAQHATCDGATLNPSASGTFNVTVSRDGTGTMGSADQTKPVAWELYLPSGWDSWYFGIVNGGRRLVVFHQGTIDPYITPNPDLPNHAFPSYDEVVCNLVASNIAVAWTSNTEHGHDLEGAFLATKPLIDQIKARSGAKPSAYYEVGFSQGGLLGPMLLETTVAGYSGLFDGALSICAPLQGMTPQLQYFGDARVLFDAYMQDNYSGSVPVVIPTSDTTEPLQPAFALPDSATALPWDIAYHPNADGTLDFARIEYDPDNDPSTLNLPAEIRASLLASIELAEGYAGSYARAYASTDVIGLPAYTPDILAYSATQALFYGVRGVNQMLRKADGLPYATRESYAMQLGAPQPISYAADEPAQNYAAAWADTTGALSARLLTLHTTDDPAVPYWHEAGYADRVAAKGASGNLRQQHVRRIGHCTFTQDELTQALDQMIRWSEGLISEPITGDVTATTDAAPTVSILAPTDAATVAGVVPISATADDDVGITHVDFYAGGSYVGTDDVPELIGGQYVWTVDWATAGNSTVDVTVEAFEAVATLSPAPRWASDMVSVSVENDVVATPPSVDSFTASDTTVTSSADVTLSWSVSGIYDTLTLSDGTTPVNVNGFTSWLVNPSVDTTYTLKATDTSTDPDTSDSATVSIDVGNAPSIVTFSASPSEIEEGTSATLSWEVTDSASVVLSNGAGGEPEAVAAIGQKTVTPSSTTTYTLDATNGYGSTAASVTITVTSAANAFDLQAAALKVRGQQAIDLWWTQDGGLDASITVTLFRDDGAGPYEAQSGIENDGSHRYQNNSRGGGSSTVWICASNPTSACSNTVAVSW